MMGHAQGGARTIAIKAFHPVWAARKFRHSFLRRRLLLPSSLGFGRLWLLSGTVYDNGIIEVRFGVD